MEGSIQIGLSRGSVLVDLNENSVMMDLSGRFYLKWMALPDEFEEKCYPGVCERNVLHGLNGTKQLV